MVMRVVLLLLLLSGVVLSAPAPFLKKRTAPWMPAAREYVGMYGGVNVRLIFHADGMVHVYHPAAGTKTGRLSNWLGAGRIDFPAGKALGPCCFEVWPVGSGLHLQEMIISPRWPIRVPMPGTVRPADGE